MKKETSPQDIRIETYDYELPEARIAKFPLEERDASNLLVYKGGHIHHRPFRELAAELPEGSLLIFNDTKVIHARLHFTLPNGATLEILCLEPLQPAEYQQNFSNSGPLRWRCLVGGNRKWKSGEIEKEILTEEGAVILKATRLGRSADAFDIQFEWDKPGLAFGELLAAAGIIPLPPYLNRENVPSDEERYQTIYAREKGSVAAPTAGLHFTDAVFEDLKKKNIERLFITLHVGAGTFRPVKSDTLAGHTMHEETVFIQRSAIEQLLAAKQEGRAVIAVGTTSTRLVESLYWEGMEVETSQRPNVSTFQRFHLSTPQWAPYETPTSLSPAEALENLLQVMEQHDQDVLQGQTQLLIAPGYTFRILNGMITNFHQPRSTLLLLIAALIGEDWQAVYRYAMDNSFRFLSYGDSSLLLPPGDFHSPGG